MDLTQLLDPASLTSRAVAIAIIVIALLLILFVNRRRLQSIERRLMNVLTS